MILMRTLRSGGIWVLIDVLHREGGSAFGLYNLYTCRRWGPLFDQLVVQAGEKKGEENGGRGYDRILEGPEEDGKGRVWQSEKETQGLVGRNLPVLQKWKTKSSVRPPETALGRTTVTRTLRRIGPWKPRRGESGGPPDHGLRARAQGWK